MPALSIASLARLADAIAAAGLDPSRWQEVMESLHTLSGGVRIHLFGHDLSLNRSIPAVTAGYAPEYLRSFEDHFGAINVWGPIMAALPVMEVAPIGPMVARRDMVRTEFWDGWLRPQEDISGGGGVVLFREHGRAFIFGGNIRHRDEAALLTPWLRLAEWTAPLMRHALEVSRMLAGLRLDAHLLRQGCDPAYAAVLVLGADRRIASANEAAGVLIEAGALLRVDAAGRVRLSDPASDTALGAALAGPLRGRAVATALPPGAEGASGAGPAWTARTLALPGTAVDLLPFPASLLATPPLTVLILKAAAPAQPAEHVARSLGLTLGEAEIAVALVEGKTPREIAALRGTSLHTVRNQIKSAMAKAECRRQSDLVLAVERARPGPA